MTNQSTPSNPPILPERTSGSNLVAFQKSLDPTIQHALRVFAQNRWPGVGWLHRKNYRLHVNADPDQLVWWVEHDVPPFDLYRCEAYFISLSRTKSNLPVLALRSGQRELHLQLSELDRLQAKLALMLFDAPLIIPRRKGVALDP